IRDWQEGAAPRYLWRGDLNQVWTPFFGTSFGDGGVAVTMRNLGGILYVLLGPGDGSVAPSVPVRGTQQTQVTGCPTIVGCPAAGDPTSCTETGDGGLTSSQAIATGDDGRLWIAYALQHIDRDVALETPGPTGNLVICGRTVVADRSAVEVELASV